MHITILSPTIFESASILNYLEQNFALESGSYTKNELTVSLSVCGVGLVNTAIHTSSLMDRPSDLFILIGLAGAFDQKYKLGDVVSVTEERFADLGAEDQDGSLLSVHDLNLINKDKPPFKDGKLINPTAAEFSFLPTAKSLSVNKVSGSLSSIALMRKKYDGDIENMEGAAFFQVCLQHRKKFLQLRSISNYVEPRNKDNWKIEEALQSLSKVVISMLDNLSGAA